MTRRLDPEAIDLAQLITQLRQAVGLPVAGNIEGRTILRDATTRLLECSQLEAEQLVDTLIARGFLRREQLEDGQIVWRPRVV
jgi:hypothetical protein